MTSSSEALTGLRPVAETVGVLAFAVEQVEVHGGTPVLDPESRERPPPRTRGCGQPS